MGTEYQSATFSQITELGVTLINLPPLRPELKSIVERSFQLIQDSVSPKQLIMTLLPRTNARFTRKGLSVFGLRYASRERNFTEEYLTGGDAIVAYNPESADTVYLVEQQGNLIEFRLIESRFMGMKFDEVKEMQSAQKMIVEDAIQNNLQAEVDLAAHVERIVGGTERNADVNIKGVRKTKKRAKRERHKDFVEEVQDEEADNKDA